MKKTTEKNSHYSNIEKMSIIKILENINKEDQKVAETINKIIPEIKTVISQITNRMKTGGRLFYIGAGTSGRLGIVDASECPPTYGVKDGLVIGLIAGGDKAIRKAVEFAEDDWHQGWKDLQKYKINNLDSVIGIAASGTTPYVVGALKKCNENGIFTTCITCNKQSPLAQASKLPIEAVVGPEFITGSTRMKAGTAQKLILNMISTTIMIKLGKIKGNRMIDMQLSNNKLVDRGVKMVMNDTGLSYEDSNKLLKESGSVRSAIKKYHNE